MGTVLRRVGRHAWALRLALSAAALIAPEAIFAQSSSTTSTALVLMPENAIPTMRLQNSIGNSFEQAMIRRGLVAGGSAGLAIGGADYAAQQFSKNAPATTATTWRNVATGGIEGAVTGAVGGCIAGAAGGLVTGGALSIPGCMAGAVGMAAAGGFFGAYGGFVKVDDAGKVTIGIDDLNKLVKIQGSGANVGTQVPTEKLTSIYPQISRDDVINDSSSIQAVFNRFGYNRTYPCGLSSYPHQCLFVPGTLLDFNSPRYSLSDGTVVRYGEIYGAYRFVSNIDIAYKVNVTVPLLFASTATYGSIADVPQYQIVSPSPSPAWAAVLGSQLNKNTSELKLSNEMLAGMINAMHDQMTRDGSLPAGVPSYDPGNPVTVDDVQAAKNMSASNQPTIGDLSRPYGNVGQEPTGASQAVPAQAPAQVITTPAPGSSTSGSTNVTVNAKVDLGDAGDQTLPDTDQTAAIPMWDKVTGALDPWKKLTINWPSLACPVFPIDIDNFFGRQIHERIDVHCQLLADGSVPDAVLGLVMVFVFSIAAVRISLSA